MRNIASEIGLERVAAVVDEFYRRVQLDPHLSQPFAVVHDWPVHKQHLTHFWWVSLGGERYADYQYQVPAKHEAAGFTPALLDIWLPLFSATLHDLLPAELALPWLQRAEKIGSSLRMLHQFYHGADAQPHTPAERIAGLSA